MKPQDVTSSWECVDEHAKMKIKQPSQPQATSPTNVCHVLEEFDFRTRPYSNASVDRAGMIIHPWYYQEQADLAL